MTERPGDGLQNHLDGFNSRPRLQMQEALNEETFQPIRVVAAVILNHRGNRILVGQRAENQSHPLKWEFIGGKVENGESPEEALCREVREETGLEIEVGRFLDVVEYDYRDLGRPSHQISFFECQKKSGVAKRDRAIYQDLKWVEFSKIDQLDWIEGNVEFANGLSDALGSRDDI